jgi:25S rRNA (cytosine2870-C5)-methyltransferase
MKNMEARSRALDKRAQKEADLDMAELQDAAHGEADDEGEFDGEEEGDFVLPTAEEREKEKASGGTPLHVLQKRMHECVRILGDFKKFGQKNR